jgi:hypothetical protein
MQQHKYIRNVDAFADSLPMSDVRFLYFRETEDAKGNVAFRPRLNKTARMWMDARLKSQPVYLVPGIRPDVHSRYVYVYKESALKYAVYLDDDKVTGFNLLPTLSSMNLKQNAGNGYVEANWGDHCTVGVELNEDENEWMFMTHLTAYKARKSDATKYIRDKYIECNMMMSDVISNKTQCYEKYSLHPMEYSLDKYESRGNDYDIIRTLQLLHRKIAGGVKAGGGEVVAYKGRRYKVSLGVRGGRKITVDGKIVRLPRPKMQKGGSDKTRHHVHDGFAEDFVQFIHDYRVVPMLTQDDRLHEVILVDDLESDQMMIRYNVDHGDGLDIVRIESQIFAMPRDLVLAAYDVAKVPVDKRTVEQKQTLESFLAPMTPIALPKMVAAH